MMNIIEQILQIKEHLELLDEKYQSVIFDYTREINKAKSFYDKILSFLEETNINLEGFDYTDEYLERMDSLEAKALKEYGYKKALLRFKKELEIKNIGKQII